MKTITYMPTRGIQEDGSINLRIDLKSPISTMLVELKDNFNFRSYAETIRFIIKEIYDQSGFIMPEETLNKIKVYLNYNHVKEKLILNPQEFIDRTISTYFNFLDN